ncbi:MAG: exonuclease SbcCD subunit D [Caldisericia bacterium]|nr:exonuclease SbcCD subunit D [Caldisericia bacterium]
MNIIHTADLHIGIENYGRQDSETLINSRLLDFFRSLDFIIQKAIQEKSDLFIISGDIYHQREPSIYVQNEFAKRLTRLSEANIPVALLIGNHDSLLALKRISSLQIFKELKVPNIFVFDEPKLITIPTKSGNIQILGLPYLEKNVLNEYFLNYSIQEKTKQEYASFIFSRLIQEFSSQIDPKIPSVLLSHLTLREAVYQNWRPAMIGNEIYVNQEIFYKTPFQYVALGHIHKPQLITETNYPVIAYSGSIDSLDFGESDFEHGFYEIEMTEKKIKPKFHNIPGQRKLVTIQIEAKDENDCIQKLLQHLGNNQHEKDIVKIIIESESSFDEQKLRREVSLYVYFIASFKYERKRVSKSRIQELNNEITPLESLKKYIFNVDDPYLKENETEIIKLTESLLSEIEAE